MQDTLNSLWTQRTVPCVPNDQWAFDIALDCVRTMKDEDRERIQKGEKIPFYHFGYGLYVRNHYVHPSKSHFGFIADNISSSVEKFIYAILIKDNFELLLQAAAKSYMAEEAKKFYEIGATDIKEQPQKQKPNKKEIM